jgi:hypothetical protein
MGLDGAMHKTDIDQIASAVATRLGSLRGAIRGRVPLHVFASEIVSRLHALNQGGRETIRSRDALNVLAIASEIVARLAPPEPVREDLPMEKIDI